MASVNKVILIGNLGQDPELRYLQSGQAVCEFSVATNEKWTDKEGEKQERTEWHSITAWGKTAENCAQYISKGSAVYIEGKLQTDKWEDKEGVKRSKTRIVAQNVTFLDRKSEGGSRRDEEDAPPPTPPPSDVPF
jgi:single-strand DNA-binding protein